MSIDALPHQRLINQRLVRDRFAQPASVVAGLGAVQSQDYHGAKWAVGQRMATATDAGLDAAFNRGEILRTHVLRPTWHFVAPEDIRWLLALSGPRVHALNAYRYRQLELDGETLAQTNAIIGGALAGGVSLTRREVATVLEDRGISTTGQRLAYIMMHAELDALVCSGPLKGKQHTYALLDERAPGGQVRTRDDALAELVRRFYSSHGPATIRDFSWWSGLTLTDAKAGIALAGSELESITVDGGAYWFGAWHDTAPPSGPLVHLLPNYDEYFSQDGMSAHSSGPDLDRFRELAAAGRVDFHHLVIDGKLRGGWRRELAAKQVRVTLDPFDELSSTEQRALQAAIGAYAAFLERSVTIA